ncbi:MAG: Mrp/NBP35 family ATP-binding protein [Planctomycetaceae bacterium]
MTQSASTNEEILNSLSGIIDPEIGRTLGELKMLKEVEQTSPESIRVLVDLPTPAYPNRERITDAIRNSLAEHSPDVKTIDVEFTSEVRGKNSGAAIGLNVKNIIAVGSGKGGVGKSTIAASLAYGLKTYGASVGLMDADVYGPSIPHMTGTHGQPAAKELTAESGQKVQRIEPLDAHGVKMISMGLFVPEEKAVVWRGPMLHRAITQFLKDTDWGPLDYLVIDMPPGTGDVSLTLSQSVGLAGAVVVCTPQNVALLDAVKAINMFQQVNIPVLGIVENMSGEIFGRGGAKQKAEEMGVPFLGEIPIDASIRVKGDAGEIAKLYADDSPVAGPLRHMCEQTAIQIAKTLLETPSMPTLEIL